MTPTAHPTYTHLSRDSRPRRWSILVATMFTSSGTRARSWHQASPFNSFRTIRTRRIAGLTLQPRKTAHPFTDVIGGEESGRAAPGLVRNHLRIRKTPWPAHAGSGLSSAARWARKGGSEVQIEAL